MSHQQVVNYIKAAGNAITFTIDPTQQMLPSNKGEELQLMETLKKGNENIYSHMPMINNGTMENKPDDFDTLVNFNI